MPGPPPPSQGSQNKECPQTPMGRLPLAELIAAVDDNANQNFNSTPVERVLWHHVPSSSQLSSSQPATTSKPIRKRSRSSSPPSSQNETSNDLSSKKQSFDLEKLQKTLKTPQADPAGDLWTRYALKTGGVLDRSPTRNEANFTELLRSSSPQTPGSHSKLRDLGGLRRSISCANEWPTSAAKRRRLNRSGSQYQALNDYPAAEQIDNAKMSRVSLLVEQVQNALSRSRAKGLNAGSHVESSPSPDKGAMSDYSQSPPIHDAHNPGDREQELPNLVFSETPVKKEVNISVKSCPHDPERLSEFEDDDFNDDELLEVVHATLAPKQPIGSHGVQNSRSMPPQTTSTETSSTIAGASSPLKIKSAPTAAEDIPGRVDATAAIFEAPDNANDNPVLYDDFEDDEEDMSAAEFEDLVATYDRHPQNSPRKGQKSSMSLKPIRKPLVEIDGVNKSTTSGSSNTVQNKRDIIEVSSDEEFGEDADFDDFVAQCAAAPQAVAQDSSVRTSYVYPDCYTLLLSVGREDRDA